MTPNKRRKAVPSKTAKPAKQPVEPTPAAPTPEKKPTPVQSLTDLPEGCNTEPYEGELNESGEPIEEAGPGRTWYQGSDGRYYNCPQSGG